MGEWHSNAINNYIPLANDKSVKNKYDKCHLKRATVNDSFILEKCNEYVYSREYFQSTLISDVI